jgi:ABC-type sugar transport system ATPase subunit
MVLVGPSGSGKSTAVRMLAGLEEVDTGAIFIGDRDVTDVEPKHRDAAIVFQNYSLYPYLGVAANIGFPLKMARSRRPSATGACRRGLASRRSGCGRSACTSARRASPRASRWWREEPGADAYAFCVGEIGARDEAHRPRRRPASAGDR